MAEKRDYYQVLGVAKTASESEIKSAYRKLARLHHPDVDKSAGAAERFKEISEAYQVLSNSEKRKNYDQFGHAAFDRSSGGAYGGNPFGGGFKTYAWSSGGAGPNAEFDFEDPFSLFEQIFGNASPFGANFRRAPVYSLWIGFNEAIKGVQKEIEIERRRSDGKIERKRMKIKVPAGVAEGTRMRFEDIDIMLQVERDPKFIREGADIFSESTLSIPQLVLGDIFEVETVWGQVKVKVPPGTQPGALVKLKGKGAPRLRSGGRGDHYVRVNLDIPQNPSKEERRLYEELKNLDSKKKSWF